MTNNERVVVVGSGLAGLTAATLLGRAGRSVVLFEKSRALGGQSRSATHLDFVLNLGPHALYRAGRAKAIWREMGLHWQAGRVSTAGGKGVRDGALHPLPAGTLALLRTGLLPATAKFETMRLLGSLPRVRAATLAGLTVSEWLDQAIQHPALRKFVAALIRLATYADAPSKQSAAAAVAQLQRGIWGGVEYVDGGWETLVTALSEAARAAGVEIRTGAVVERVDETLNASSVILATTPAEAASLLGSTPAGDWLRRECAAMTPVRAACLDLCLSRLPDPATRFVLGVDRPLYFSVHSAFARLAPAGGALIHAAFYKRDGETHDDAAIERELLALVDQAQPGWRAHLVHRRYLPNMIVSHRLHAGSAIPCEVPGASGIYLAAEWVGAEGMLADAAVASAHRAVGAILKTANARTCAA